MNAIKSSWRLQKEEIKSDERKRKRRKEGKT
jgi:hypothetical protein